MQNSRDRLIELIQYATKGCSFQCAEKTADYLIEHGVIVIPVHEVKHGKWVKSDYPQMLVCSSCRDAYVFEDWVKNDKWHYCPHCGAKMDGKESEA